MQHRKLFIALIGALAAGMVFAGTALAGGTDYTTHTIDSATYDCSTNTISATISYRIDNKPTTNNHTVTFTNISTGQSVIAHSNNTHVYASLISETIIGILTVHGGDTIQITSTFTMAATTGNRIVTRNASPVNCGTLDDGRLNPYPHSNAVIYCSDTEGIHVYGYHKDSKVWSLAFYVSAAELAALPAKPAANTLIKQVVGISLYKLTTGEYQLNAGPDSEGKTVVFIWRACRRDTLYWQELETSLAPGGMFAMSPSFIQ